MRFREAQKFAIDTEIVNQPLLGSQNLCLFRCADELDDVALFSVTLFINERILQTGVIIEIGHGAKVFDS